MLVTFGQDGHLVWAVFGMIAVIFGAYYVTILVAKRANAIQQGRAVRVLDRFSLGKDKMFCLLQMGDIVYLVGMADGAITVIDRVTGERAQAVCESCQSRPEAFRKGLNTLSDFVSRRRFNMELDAARQRLGRNEQEMDVEQLTLKFAREEDDIDAMLRKIDTRKKSREAADSEDEQK